MISRKGTIRPLNPLSLLILQIPYTAHSSSWSRCRLNSSDVCSYSECSTKAYACCVKDGGSCRRSHRSARRRAERRITLAKKMRRELHAVASPAGRTPPVAGSRTKRFGRGSGGAPRAPAPVRAGVMAPRRGVEKAANAEVAPSVAPGLRGGLPLPLAKLPPPSPSPPSPPPPLGSSTAASATAATEKCILRLTLLLPPPPLPSL
mmetsp:Transcript_24701/g.61556  ORF Transcript_24701/g.61556 Transcript_24701/m.61556 type:complete len:205 (+) Transcript_24701:228-842(+)